jgi:hypothetical protein
MGSVLQLQTLGIEYLTTDMKTERKKHTEKETETEKSKLFPHTILDTRK